MEDNPHLTIYDRNSYYEPQGGSRLWPSLHLLLNFFDWLRARQITKKLGFIGSAIDVGAGNGTFLYFLRHIGWKISGTTASLVSQKFARSKFNVELLFQEEIPEKGAFDLITYWHVFEHLKDPECHARLWPVLLTERGAVVIEVPNVDSLGARIKYDSWLGSDPDYHINHQTSDEISALLKKNRLAIFKRETFSLKFSYVFMWSALLGLLFGRFYPFAFIMQFLRDVKKSFGISFFRTLNALASILYLAPLVVLLLSLGVALGRGEIIRIYARKTI